MAQLNESAMLMFDKEDEKINDVCLVVEDRKFWCSKQHLSLHSEYFCSMFNGDFPEANMKEIILNDPENSKDFHLYLLIINGLRPFDEFDDKAVTRVLALSNQWIAKIASGICMDHLLKSEKSTLKDKYILAEAYKLEDYKEQLIASIKTKEDLASIVYNDQISLDQATKDKLFQKSLELLGIPKAPEQAPNPPTASPFRELQRHLDARLEAQQREEIQHYGEQIRRLQAQVNAQQGGDPQLEQRRLEGQRQYARRRLDELNHRNVLQDRRNQPRPGDRRRREAQMRGAESPRRQHRLVMEALQRDMHFENGNNHRMTGNNQSSMLLFDKEDERINDVCLVVEDRKFWCSKQHLSLHSEYFCSMFNGDFPEANMKEIVLNDPDNFKDFHLFLLIINGLRPFDDFDDKAVTRVLALSNLWIAKIASGICMDHLLKSEKSSLKDKYVLADAYKLEDYKEQLIASIKTKEELASIVHNDQISLDQVTKDKLFLKSLELLGISETSEPGPSPPTESHREMQEREEAQQREEARNQIVQRYRNGLAEQIQHYGEQIRRLQAQGNAQQGGDPQLEMRRLESERQYARMRLDELDQPNVLQDRLNQPRPGERRRREAQRRGAEAARQRQRLEMEALQRDMHFENENNQ
ncbi:unnamed protein product [Caenorhabditis brenneri]